MLAAIYVMKKSISHHLSILAVIFLLGNFLSTIILPPVSARAAHNTSPSQPGSQLHFFLLAPNQGWLHSLTQLFWTDTNGTSWRDITPTLLSNQTIQSVFFLDASQGWVVLHSALDSPLAYQIASTQDAGLTWNTTSFTALESEQPAQTVSQVFMQWLDTKNGFILFKLLTGNQFSLGLLYSTADGGQTWQSRQAPIGDPFYFAARQNGFIAGGPNNDQLYRTTDAGNSWNEIGSSLKNLVGTNSALFSLPSFSPTGYGMLAMVDMLSSERQQLLLLESFDWGETWIKRAQVKLPSEHHFSIPPALHMLSRDVSRVWLPKHLWKLEPTQDLFSSIPLVYKDAYLQQLVMADSDFGWGLFVKNTCSQEQPLPNNNDINCAKSSALATTKDSGITWEPLPLPPIQIDLQQKLRVEAKSLPATSSLDLPAKTQVFTGQGFDKCEIPPLDEMQTWWDSSPYKTINLYIGGISRYCDNEALTADYVSQMADQGWQFFPTWVGPQAPCSRYTHKISSDPTTAYQEGIENANQAVATLLNLGLTLDDSSGSVVYYDLEAYTGDEICNAAVGAFLNGWTLRLHQLGNLSGLYGSACGSYLSEYFLLPNPPDVIWPAVWLSDYEYDPDASVWGLKCISDTVYTDHQRIRQYTGGHVETWGDVSMSIDCDVLDGVVGVPYLRDLLPPISSLSLEGKLGLAGWYTSQVIVNLSAIDSISGVSYSQYNLDGAGWETYSSPIILGEQGIHTLLFQSIDLAGNWESIQTATIKIDSEAPHNPDVINPGCSALDKTWQNFCNNPSFTWSGASDTLSGLAGYELYWGIDPNGSEGILIGENTYDPTSVSDGSYHLRIRTRDQAGNWSAFTRLYTLRYDGSPPTGSLTLENGSEITNQVLVDLQLSAYDTTSGLGWMHIRAPGGEWTNWMPYMQKLSWILPGETLQWHSLEIQYQDLAGNFSPIVSDSIYLNIYPSKPKSQGFVLQQSTFGLSATHAKSTNFALDGTLEQSSAVGEIDNQSLRLSSGFWSLLSWLANLVSQYLPLIMK